ncbi:trigger factor [Humisphaera borealis]|uniref:Trigger factor n=1 Tax=Humisphaera borealis TaxID=2807512 RepID=A0A7M2WYT1_9BACT|nr:trigger factor [Humisphaera borealis]QOV90553.1 trigger factor [Humisphaera borealis]
MSETQTAEATETVDAVEQPFEYPVTVEDAGSGSKKVSVEIPRDRIDTEIKKQFGELRKQAALPGFRVGRAPQKLIEKRFATDVKNDVRRSLISESYEQAIEKNKLQVLGEPEFEDIEKAQIPDDGGPLKYSFNVEVQPDFILPDIAQITVKKPKIDIKEENIDQAMTNLREQQGALVPVEDRGVEEKDYMTADVHVKLEGKVVAHQHDAQLVARPGRIGGVQIDDLADKVKGMKAGETRNFTVKAPENHPDETARGKDLEVEVAVKDIKRLELAAITESFLADLGFEKEAELRDALREQMQEKIDFDVQTAMREQVARYLYENVTLDLPQKMSERQVDRVIQRRAMDLMMRGATREQLEANIEALRAGAGDEAQRELKLFFILQKLAADLGVDVDEEELNGRIAYMAIQRDQRPETLKKEMANNGQLVQMYIQMREQKALDKVLETVKVEVVEVKPEEEKKAE